MTERVIGRTWRWVSGAMIAGGMIYAGGCADNVLTVQHGGGGGGAETTAASSDLAVRTSALKPLADSTFFVAVPRDGMFEGRTNYPGSGQLTANLISSSLRPRTRRVEQALGPVEYEYLVSRARELKADYLVNPQIFNWENRSNTWTGKDDRVSLRIDIIDVATGARVDAAALDGSGKKNVRVPQDLLRPLIRKWADELK